MSTGTTKSPALPNAPVEYNQQYIDQVLNVLRLYFQQLDTAGPSAASTQRSFVDALNQTVVISAMNFSTVDQVSKVRIVSLPTQLDLANMRVGDLYYDTAANNVIKIKV